MKRITDFRVGELRIPADRFPLPPKVEEMLRLYCGPGQWEGNTAVFELPLYRLAEIEAAMRKDVAGDEE
jgi:hypothetical protein